MIDYFFRWATEADARQDALMLADYLNVTPSSLREWARDKVLPNVSAWRPSQDTITVSSLSSIGTVVTHNFIAGWSAIISLRNQASVLINATALSFALDRDGPPYVIKNNIGAVISDIAVEPIFAGSHYPIGGLSS